MHQLISDNLDLQSKDVRYMADKAVIFWRCELPHTKRPHSTRRWTCVLLATPNQRDQRWQYHVRLVTRPHRCGWKCWYLSATLHTSLALLPKKQFELSLQMTLYALPLQRKDHCHILCFLCLCIFCVHHRQCTLKKHLLVHLKYILLKYSWMGPPVYAREKTIP